MPSAEEQLILDEIETKNIIDWIVNEATKIFNITWLKEKISAVMKKQYLDGLEKAEVKFNMNFVPAEKDIELLNTYVFKNFQQHTDEIGEALRQELSRGLLNKENIRQLQVRVANVFDDPKYMNRLKMVLRTEKVRAGNYGQLDGAKQAGLKLKKWVSIVDDDRTSDICLQEDSEYGSPKKAIPIDEAFIVHVDNKTISAQAPPFHPNCRSVIMFERVAADE